MVPLDAAPAAQAGAGQCHLLAAGQQRFKNRLRGRKFALAYIDREDIVPLTEIAARTTGLPTYDQLLSLP